MCTPIRNRIGARGACRNSKAQATASEARANAITKLSPSSCSTGRMRSSRQPNDPELLAARALMAEESLVDAIAKALKKAPPMTPQVRERVLGCSSHPGV